MSSSKVDEAVTQFFDKLYQEVEKSNDYLVIRGILSFLVKNIESSNSAKKFLKSFAPSLLKRIEKSKPLLIFFREESKLQGGTDVTMRKAFVYLGLFETVLTNYIDSILMLFLALHHDIFHSFGRKYVTSLTRLDFISLSDKQIFLEHHDLGIFKDKVNRDLRNKLAHMDFELKSDGKIIAKNKTYDLDDEITTLMAFLVAVNHALEKAGVHNLLAKLI